MYAQLNIDATASEQKVMAPYTGYRNITIINIKYTKGTRG